MYTVAYTPAALKSLQKLNKHTAQLLTAWVGKNLLDCPNPRAHGKGLSANLAGAWRYRIGDYRIIADINDATKTILILDIGHRGTIYR